MTIGFHESLLVHRYAYGQLRDDACQVDFILDRLQSSERIPSSAHVAQT